MIYLEFLTFGTTKVPRFCLPRSSSKDTVPGNCPYSVNSDKTVVKSEIWRIE